MALHTQTRFILWCPYREDMRKLDTKVKAWLQKTDLQFILLSTPLNKLPQAHLNAFPIVLSPPFTMFKKICTAFSCLCLNSAAFLIPDLLLQDSNPYHFHWKSPTESLFLQEDCQCYPIQAPRQWIRIRQMKRNKTNHIYMALSSHTTFKKNSVCTWTLNMVHCTNPGAPPAGATHNYVATCLRRPLY